MVRLKKHVQTELRRRGLRFRKHVKYLPGSPDIVFAKEKVAVFIDGDFWHGWRLPLGSINCLPSGRRSSGPTGSVIDETSGNSAPLAGESSASATSNQARPRGMYPLNHDRSISCESHRKELMKDCDDSVPYWAQRRERFDCGFGARSTAFRACPERQPNGAGLSAGFFLCAPWRPRLREGRLFAVRWAVAGCQLSVDNPCES